MNSAAIGQTIAVVDKSGKVVSTSKHLINVFKEAKLAYRERKAEIVAERRGQLEEKRTRHALEAYTIDDTPRRGTSRHSPVSGSTSRPGADRRHSSRSTRSATSPIYPAFDHYEGNVHTTSSGSRKQELVRSHTTQSNGVAQRASPTRSMSTPAAIDMDLAYGEIPPPLPLSRPEEELELKGLVGKVKMLLDEAECAQYSVTAIVANLQKNPDAMAAVALTLAEISNIVAKMSPGVITALKGSAPAVFALLASPQFMIAAGVGVGITIVAFGGYKIIKKIKAKNAQDNGMDEMLELGPEVNRIENWRRGITEVDAESIGTSVDGEFITPQAAFMSREALHGERHREPKKEKKSKKSEKTSKSSSSKSSKTLKPEKEKKVNKPSPLRLMFT
ncbi:hypothetical protein MMC16_001811 [Acarospora aff. strigata]|nr:hypothetical protein [Acarospora aff. strigata]